MSDATSYATEQQAIMDRIDMQWRSEITGDPRTPIAWPNTQTPPPDNAAYIQPFVNRQQPFNADIAPARRIRHPGLLTIDIRTPLNQGDGAALALADHASDMFRNITFDGLTFRVPRISRPVPDGSSYRVQVDCPYHRDSIH